MGRPRGPAAILPAAPAFTFGSRTASPQAELVRAPGPGAYGVPRLSTSDHLSSPCIGFGTSMRPAPYGANRAPPPGTYSPRDRLVRSASPQYTFKGVAAKDYKVRNPGPGQYQPQAHSAHSTAPAVSMAQRLQPPHSHSRHPAPNEYSPYRSSPYMDKGLPVTLKFRHERTLARAEVAPGPGEYVLASSLGGRAHSIATKLKASRAQDQAPGPAAYEVFDSTIGTAGKL